MDEHETVAQDPGSRQSVPERIGAVEKCPVCGSRVDREAYHCPTCRNTFCFHCRARILPSDIQFQCVSQQCEYYGKLLCDVCEEMVEEDSPPAVYLEPQEGYWPLLLIPVLVTAWFIWSWSFASAVLWVLIGFPVIGFLLHVAGLNIFGKNRRVEHPRKSRFHRCLCCQQPVKEIFPNAAVPNNWYGVGTAPGQMTGSSQSNLLGGGR